jgi:hypothetical protein
MPLRFVAAGLGAREIHRALQQYPNDVEARVTNDIEGARAVQQGTADYYIGSCYSGQGGALAAAIAVLGLPATAMVGVPGRGADRVRIREAIQRGVRAFGMTQDQISEAVPALVAELLQRRGAGAADPG